MYPPQNQPPSPTPSFIPSHNSQVPAPIPTPIPNPSLRDLTPRHDRTRGRQQQARPTPPHDGQVIVIFDQCAHDDRPNDREGRGYTIHHAGPLAEAPLLGLGKEGSDTRGWEADHSAGDDTEEADESDGTSEIGGEWPEGEDEDGGNEGGREVDVEGTVARKGERVLVGGIRVERGRRRLTGQRDRLQRCDRWCCSRLQCSGSKRSGSHSLPARLQCRRKRPL